MLFCGIVTNLIKAQVVTTNSSIIIQCSTLYICMHFQWNHQVLPLYNYISTNTFPTNLHMIMFHFKKCKKKQTKAMPFDVSGASTTSCKISVPELTDSFTVNPKLWWTSVLLSVMTHTFLLCEYKSMAIKAQAFTAFPFYLLLLISTEFISCDGWRLSHTLLTPRVDKKSARD